MAKRLKRDNEDVVGEKCIRNDEGKFILTVDDKLKAWQSHHQKLLNVQLSWGPSNLSDEPTVEGPVIKITTEMTVSYPVIFWTYRYIYLLCNWVELKVGGLIRKPLKFRVPKSA